MDRHRAVRHSDPALHPGIPFQYDRRYGQRPAPHVDLTALWDRNRAHPAIPSHLSQLPGVLLPTVSVYQTTEGIYMGRYRKI